ncbi:MAG: multiheme c-type cytochrome [Candidatus Aminicenantales bacterium]
MKRIFIPSGILISIILAAGLFSQGLIYVGVQKCQICHKTERQGMQFPIWEKSRHSKSFSSLSSPQASTAAQVLGVTNPPESPKCLTCHAPLFERAPELKAEGVTCEVCHGPGSEYKKLSVMRNRDEAAKNGLVVYADADAVKTLCLSCHQNAHGKPFDFKAAWENIKHTIPEKR